MNKNQLVSAIHDRVGGSLKDVQKYVDAFVVTVEDTVVSGEKVVIPGFGTFEARDVAAREGVDPSSGQRRAFPASRRAVFKVGTQFKARVKGEQS